MKGGRRPQERGREPAGVEDVPRVVAALQRNDGIREVGQDQHDEGDEDQLQRRNPGAGREEEADEHAEQEDVETG